MDPPVLVVIALCLPGLPTRSPAPRPSAPTWSPCRAQVTQALAHRQGQPAGSRAPPATSDRCQAHGTAAPHEVAACRRRPPHYPPVVARSSRSSCQADASDAMARLMRLGSSLPGDLNQRRTASSRSPLPEPAMPERPRDGTCMSNGSDEDGGQAQGPNHRRPGAHGAARCAAARAI